MLVFDENETCEEGIWREYEPGINVKIRPIDKDKYRELKKLSKRMARRPGEKLTAEQILDRLLFRHMVEDWDGIVDTQGKPIKRTDEMVDKIMSRMVQLANWVADESAALAENVAIARSGELKNLNGSHDGSDSGQTA